jgi:hypothetical protein
LSCWIKELTATVSAPRVFGYVRVGSRHRIRVERWRQRIAEYCRAEGLALELVFADAGVPDTEPLRPGWTALLDVLNPKDAQMVIVPSEAHLSFLKERGLSSLWLLPLSFF